jgi:hypothetical protein
MSVWQALDFVTPDSGARPLDEMPGGLADRPAGDVRAATTALLWREVLHRWARLPREELMRALAATAPLIVHLGGQAALREGVIAIDDVCRWWP